MQTQLIQTIKPNRVNKVLPDLVESEIQRTSSIGESSWCSDMPITLMNVFGFSLQGLAIICLGIPHLGVVILGYCDLLLDLADLFNVAPQEL